MTDHVSDLVILGGGSAGYAAALRAAELGRSVVLVEQDRLGGTCLHRGCIPTKALLHSAEVADQVRAAASVGIGATLEGVDAEAVAAFRERIVAKKFAGLEGLVRARGITVVAGVGAAPHTEIAAAAGLLVEDGIVVDEQLRTSDPRVWAAGDCAAFPDARSGHRVRVESWRSAHDQAVTVAASMTGGQEPHVAVPWLWSDQYDQMLQTAGLPTTAVTEVVRERADGSLIHFGLDAGGRLVAATSLGRGPVVAKDIRVAEQLIATRATPDPAALADPGVALRSLR